MTDSPALAPIDHDRFVAHIRALAAAIREDGWLPDYLVGVGRGGLVPAAYLSHATGVALLSVDHSSNEPGFALELLHKLADKTVAGRRLLIVDDINDSGSTIAALRSAIAAAGGVADHVRVAVLIDNVRSTAKADYRALSIDRAQDKRWFVFPWEAMAPRAAVLADAAEVPERLG